MKINREIKRTILLLFFTSLGMSQELPQIVPLSPNAASITKYGEVPVSHFTGIPNINIPIYSINTGELTLPLSLSYHAGGNKVESISSWVGLGWSLGAIPSISRSVRGIPDDAGGGYFHQYSGYTIEEIAELDPGHPVISNLRSDLYSGNVDSEPDIFYFNLPANSGKFFYHQETASFNTYPRSNVKILQDGDNFRVITQEGLEYIFDIVETNKANNDLPIRSTWYASKMISPTKKDTIHFNYRDEDQITKTRNVVTKYHYLSGVSAGMPSDQGSILNNNLTKAKIIESITFKNGQIWFNRQTQERQDLQGGYALDNISIYNTSGLISKYEFVTSYLTGNGAAGAGTPCYNVDSYSKKWMFLDKIRQVSPTSSETMDHEFIYDQANSPPCRNSAAQDYWGFYNGENSNEDLTPTYYLPNTNPPVQISAADRGIDPIKSKFGILKRITYPTGGYTEFDFENNLAFANDIQVQYSQETEILAGEEFIDFGQPIPEINSFEKTFTINNPPDSFLNNNNPDGGAYVRFIVEFPGCNISQNANNCARFTVNGVTNSFPLTDILNPNSGGVDDRVLFLPNGTYKLTTSFNQTPPNYQDFIFIAEWDVVETTQTENKYVGGLRIKEIRSYPNSLSEPITKKYKYTVGYNSSTSSGDIFHNPNFSHSEEVVYISGQVNNGETETNLLRVRSTSNMPQVTHSGSSVGYEKVFEETSDVNETGYTEYRFSHMRDISFNNFPYPPSKSKEVYRGQLLEQSFYKKSGIDFELIQKKSMEYFDTPYIYSGNTKYSLSLKWGNTLIHHNPSGPTAQAQVLTYYTVDVGWNNLKRELVTNYFENDSMQTTTSYHYDNSDHLLKTRTDTKNSKGELLITLIKYPQDIIAPSLATAELILQNRLGEVVEIENYLDVNYNGSTDTNEILNKQKNIYEIWSPNVVSVSALMTAKANSPLENRIEYHNYDENGNPVEISRTDGSMTSFIWGYNNQYPIAKIENANYEEIRLALGLSSTQDVESLDENDIAIINGLRGISSMSEAMVTTYTYNPLVGLTSITDPKGYTTYYEYDDFNRLEFIKDHDFNLINQFEYRFSGQ